MRTVRMGVAALALLSALLAPLGGRGPARARAAPAAPGPAGAGLTAEVRFAGVATECLVDTGSMLTVVPLAFVQTVPGASRLQEAQLVAGLGGAVVAGELWAVPEVAAHDLVWADAVVGALPDAALALHQSCLLGLDLLRRQPLLFDWGARRFAVP